MEEFPADSFGLVTYIMDTKRNPSKDYVEKKSAQLYDSILIEDPDIVYIPTNGAVKGWNKEEAVDFVYRNISLPLVTREDFMMPYVVVGVTKIAKEQGIWAATTAQKILMA